MKHASPLRRMLLRTATLCTVALFCPNIWAQQQKTDELTAGTDAPDIILTGIDGKEFKLSDVTGSGKNVALMFSRAHW